MQRRRMLTPPPERLRARARRTHPLLKYLLCQIVCLSFNFDDAAVVVEAKGVGGVFTVVHRETELLRAFAPREEDCFSRALFSLSSIYEAQHTT